MTRGPLQLFCRRTLRALAGFVATFLLAGHVLAATGLCVVTSPDSAAAVHEAGTSCAEHAPADAGQAHVKHHCPAEEPSPQARSVDLPAAQPVAVVDTSYFHFVDALSDRLPQASAGHEVPPPPPLYARLQRLRL